MGNSSSSASEPEQGPTVVRTCRSRKRPLKNAREKRRRADIKTKLTELYNLIRVHSDAEAKGLQVPQSGTEHTTSKPRDIPNKKDILTDAIKFIEDLDEQLVGLRIRNKRLRSANNAHEI